VRWEQPKDFREIISWWKYTNDLAKDLGVPDSTVRQWKVRNSIPADFWSALCETTTAERNQLTAWKLAKMIDFRK
jgi:hypothetical protein